MKSAYNNLLRAAAAGDLATMKKCVFGDEARTTSAIIDAAIASENADCVKYASENGCPFGERSVYAAAYYGFIDAIIYSHEQHGCEWTDSVNRGILKHLACLKYGVECGNGPVITLDPDYVKMKYLTDPTHENKAPYLGCPFFDKEFDAKVRQEFCK